MVDKITTREHGFRVRLAMGSEKKVLSDRKICGLTTEILDWRSYSTVLIFAPIELKLEVDIWPLTHWIWVKWPRIKVYAPRIIGNSMEAVSVSPATRWVKGKYGVSIPVSGEVLGQSEHLDLVLTPLLGFDPSGQRVGYGRGYYDRFFLEWPAALRIGVGYEDMLIREGIAAEVHDVRLNMVVTETQVRKFV